MSYIQPLLVAHDAHAVPSFLLDFYGRTESKLQAGPYRPYRKILEGVLTALGRATRLPPLCRCVGGISRQHRRLAALPGYDRVAEGARLALPAGGRFEHRQRPVRPHASAAQRQLRSRHYRGAGRRVQARSSACSKPPSSASACRRSESCTWHRASITTLRRQRRWDSTRCGSTATTATAAAPHLHRMQTPKWTLRNLRELVEALS